MVGTASEVSVIICAYTEKRWDDLVAAVASIQKQTLPPCETIVVVDHNASLFEQVQAHIPGIITIKNNATRGLSGARNTGLTIARGAYIAFLDDDAEAEPDWLERLYYACVDSHVLGIGGALIPRWLNRRPVWFPPEFYWVIGCTYQTTSEQPAIIRNPYGGCTCIKREVFAEIGGFRDDIGRVGTIPLGGEETELSIRAKQRWPQKVFLHEPRAIVHHRIPIDRTRWRYFRARCYAEGLSKAIITRYVGAKDSLSSECNYVLHTLPLGVLHGLRDTLFRHDLIGLLRAGAIIAGFLITTIGYIVGTIIKLFTFRKSADLNHSNRLRNGALPYRASKPTCTRGDLVL